MPEHLLIYLFCRYFDFQFIFHPLRFLSHSLSNRNYSFVNQPRVSILWNMKCVRTVQFESQERTLTQDLSSSVEPKEKKSLVVKLKRINELTSWSVIELHIQYICIPVFWPDHQCKTNCVHHFFPSLVGLWKFIIQISLHISYDFFPPLHMDRFLRSMLF